MNKHFTYALFLLSALFDSPLVLGTTQCPKDGFASIYENKIYQLRYITCLKKIKKKLVKHGPYTEMSFDGRINKQEFYLNGEKVKDASALASYYPPAVVSKEIVPKPLSIWVHKVVRLHLPDKKFHDLKNSNHQTLNVHYDKETHQLVLVSSRPGQAELLLLDAEGEPWEKIVVTSHPIDIKKSHIISGNNELVYFLSSLEAKKESIKKDRVLAIIPEGEVAKVEVWDQDILEILHQHEIVRLKGKAPGRTHVRVHFKNKPEPARIDIDVR